jgi:Leu/Phe-tRNA-protein transferase
MDWISLMMMEAYRVLASLGLTHSVEAWDEAGSVTGGVYEIRANRPFLGCSASYARTLTSASWTG